MTLDYLIIGGGPAGRQLAALLAAEGKRDHLVLETAPRRVAKPGAEFVVDARRTRCVIVTAEVDGSAFAGTCRPRLVEGEPALTEEWESVNVPGLFFAGTVPVVRALHNILERRYGEPWPADKLDGTPESITDAVIDSVNRPSALADVVTVAGPDARHHREVPVDYFEKNGLFTADHDYENAFVVTVESGHPVVRYHREGELVATRHLPENVENEPLAAFLAGCLSGAEG